MTKKEIIDNILKIEGGYTNDSSDSGGETNYGITKRTAISYGYRGSIRNLPKELAFEIYEKKYWDKLKLDKIFKIAPKTAEKMFDIGVNAGTSRAGKWLQTSINALNHKGRYSSGGLVVDGAVGRGTLGAFKAFIKHRGKNGDEVMRRMLNALQGNHYINIALKYPKNKKYTYGWVSNRVQ